MVNKFDVQKLDKYFIFFEKIDTCSSKLHSLAMFPGLVTSTCTTWVAQIHGLSVNTCEGLLYDLYP